MAAANPRPQQTDVRSRILSAALDLIESEGVAAMTQPRVAAVAGLRQSHLTYYYPRRADLLLAVLAYSHERADEESGSHDAFERMESLLFAEKRARFFLAVVVEVSADPSLRPVLAEHLDHFRHEVAALFGRRPDDLAVVAFIDEVRGSMIRSLLHEKPMKAEDLRRIGHRLFP